MQTLNRFHDVYEHPWLLNAALILLSLVIMICLGDIGRIAFYGW